MLLEEFVLFQDYECTGVQMQYTYLPEFSDRLFSQSLLAYVLEGEVQYQREEKTLSVPRGDFIFFRDYVVLSTNDLPAALLGILFR